eukprot:TRINITY_DN49195_c0_g1_i1.p1 TRINITY_DN49195_c0_g1~~TRINITY_DN49195_c0_g1_i1.p1  ORF type:complete len:286 (+),score=111.72 TRINITY_DN49195_c0_g1_i1:153-1010(+)
MSKLNVRNPAVKRLMKELRQFEEEPSDEFVAYPLDDNLFVWHFTIKGPPDTEFEGGLYHGVVLLPAEYPFKPPDIKILTPSGRFEVGKKICLSITGYHPKSWQPSWGIRTALVALRAFFPTAPKGAIGSLDMPKDQRRKLALKSQQFKCKICGHAVCDEFPTESVVDDENKAETEQPKPEQQEQQEQQEQEHPKQEQRKQEQPKQDQEQELEAAEEEEEAAAVEERPRRRRRRRTSARRRAEQQQQAAASSRRSDTALSVLTVLLAVALAVLLFRKFYYRRSSFH